MQNLLVRADGGEEIGMGHLVRCRALGQAWSDAGGEVRFASSGETAAETAALAASFGAPWVVVDGYQFHADYVDALRQAGLRVLFVDDNGHAERYPADLVLNQNLHASAELYAARGPASGLLLGPRYALLRREFLPARGEAETPEVGRRVLVTMGGGDPDNVTGKVVRSLAQLNVPDLEAVVVVGPANPHYAAIRKAVAKLPFTARVVRNASNMPQLMAWADVAISAAGSTCWELAFMGLPALVIVWANNQQCVAESLHQAGVAESLGEHNMLASTDIAAALQCLLRSRRMRCSMAQRGRALIDGRGAQRVVERMRKPLHFRPVAEQDCRLLWEWVNDPAVRTSAFSSDPVLWPTHVAWFRSKRCDSRTVQWIALDGDGLPIGQVRFEGDGPGDATIDVSVASEQRAKGYGGMLIAAAVDELFRTSSVEAVHALVKTRNQPSLRAFRYAGFRELGVESVDGQKAEHLVRRRHDA
jgi:UDP-2,4-diacetamido-2,4,6-trideoxy-beta-L-altropyranose hydrolase